MTNRGSSSLVLTEAIPSVRLRRCQVSDLGIVKCPISASSRIRHLHRLSSILIKTTLRHIVVGVSGARSREAVAEEGTSGVYGKLLTGVRGIPHSLRPSLAEPCKAVRKAFKRREKALASFRALRVNEPFYGKAFTPFSGTRSRTCTASTLSCRNTPSEAGARPANRLR